MRDKFFFRLIVDRMVSFWGLILVPLTEALLPRKTAPKFTTFLQTFSKLFSLNFSYLGCKNSNKWCTICFKLLWCRNCCRHRVHNSHDLVSTRAASPQLGPSGQSGSCQSSASSVPIQIPGARERCPSSRWSRHQRPVLGLDCAARLKRSSALCDNGLGLSGGHVRLRGPLPPRHVRGRGQRAGGRCHPRRYLQRSGLW